MHHVGMRKLAWLLLPAFFLINPGFACVVEPEFTYGAAELRATIEGDWAVTITPAGGTPTEYQMTLKQATSAPASAARVPAGSLVRAAHACNDRTLLASANACSSATIMPLTVTLAQGSPPVTGAPKGTFRVDSLNFTQGDLLLDVGDLHVTATISPDRAVLGTPTVHATSGAVGTVTVRHLP